MKLINIVTKVAVIVIAVFTMISCDNDFNSVGSEIIGDVNFEDKQYVAKPITYSRKLEKVQTSDLIIQQNQDGSSFHANILGLYNDPVYGESTYSVLSQALPAATSFPINFGDNPVLDSVVLNLPYFSELLTTNIDTDVNTYRLDSIYGNQPVKLSVFQSNYFLRDFDPESSDRQIYYSDDLKSFETSAIEGDGVPLFVIESYVPSAAETVLLSPDGSDEGSDPDITRSEPALRVVFEEPIRTKFEEQFLDKVGSAELSNPNNFLNYFRGIYFKIEPVVEGTGNLIYVNMRSGNITLHYTSDLEADSEDGETSEQRELVLSFTNNVINAIDRVPLPALPSGLNIEEQLTVSMQDSINGENNLYLKGGNGAYAVIDLFGRYVETDANGDFVLNENGDPIFVETPENPGNNDKTELDFIRAQDWLVNDASFRVYVNQSEVVPGAAEPERIFIFNAETGQPLIDHNNDLVNTEEPVNSRTNHLGRISRDSDGKGEFYKIRLTEYIISLINDEEIDNIKLGLSVSQNVNITTSAIGVVKNKNNTPKDKVIPTSSIISHEGTILYGNTEDVPDSKRLKLDIFYTASKNN